MRQGSSSTETDTSLTSGKFLRVGIIGVGTIAEALTIALCAFGEPRAQILLSPRNEAVSVRLARRFSNVEVAYDNQAVVDGSELLVLAVRPQVTEEVLGALRFRPDLRILSLVATFSTARLSPLVAPAGEISRAVPLPPVARRQGPLALYTNSAEVVRLLDGLGRLIRVEEEAHLDLISAATSLMGTYFGMAGAVDTWMKEHGFAPEASRAFVGELFLNLALAAATEHPRSSFDTLRAEYSTPGGLNEQAWRELRHAGWAGEVQDALDLVLRRIHGHATAESRLDKAER